MGNSSEIEKATVADSDAIIFDTISLIIDGTALDKGTYSIQYDSRYYRIGSTTWPLHVTVSARLYFPPGFHHCIVVVMNRLSAHDRPGHARFLSFWFEMESIKVPQLEFDVRDVPAQRRGEQEDDEFTTSWHHNRDFTLVTCCVPFGSLIYHTDCDSDNPCKTWSMVDRDPLSWWEWSGIPEFLRELPIGESRSSYSESQCEHVWADVILVAERWDGFLASCAHYWMEFLSNLFFVVEGRVEYDSEDGSADSSYRRPQQKPLFIIRNRPRRAAHDGPQSYSTLPYRKFQAGPYHAALWPMLSDREWVEWDDVMAMVYMAPSGEPRLSPSYMCFRRLHVFHDSSMTMEDIPETISYWRMYRESLWTHLGVPIQRGVPAEILGVLFLRRPGGRRLLNHDEIAVMLQSLGFQVRTITPDLHSLAVVASTVARASLLVGIGSGAYNAVFLPTGCGVLEICATENCASLYGERVQPWQLGFQRLGVHQVVYACPHLYTRDFQQVASSSSGVALNGTAAGTLGVEPPIVVSPRTILTLLHELVGTLEEVRESGSEMGSVTTKECFPWEAEHSRSVDPMALEKASLGDSDLDRAPRT
jgi:hypothetical protein